MATIGYTQHGSGSQGVIVLHGWMGDYSMYAPMVPYLDENRYSYAFVDYRGYGKSKALSGDYTFDEIVSDATALADQLGWERFHLLGHSMGGKAAQRIIANHEDRVKSAVLLASVPGTSVPLEGEVRERIFGAAQDHDKRRAIINAGTGMRLSAEWLKWMVDRSYETTSVEAFSGYTKAWVDEDFKADLEGKNTPTLAVVGAHDMSITKVLMENTLAKWLKNLRIEVLDAAGHYPMQEIPIYTLTLAEQFFNDFGQ